MDSDDDRDWRDLLAQAPPFVHEEQAARLLLAALRERRKLVQYPRCDLARLLPLVAGERGEERAE